jgi:hypothetical protein
MKRIKRNYGFGKSLKHAAKGTLKEYLGEKYSTIASHHARFKHFASYCQQKGTSNAVFITPELFLNYALVVQEKTIKGQLSTAYAHNLISSVNVVMQAFRRNKTVWLSPIKLFGPRSHIRQIAPNMDLIDVRRACKQINLEAGNEISMIIWLARLLGLRLKEAILLDASLALKQARTKKEVDIRKGTKGGRGKKVERLIPVNKRIVFALEKAAAIQGKRHSFIPKNESLIVFYRRIHRVALPILKDHSINKIHDLRAAFACDEYKKQIGIDAPVISGKKIVKTSGLKEKLRGVSKQLGHNREYVIDSYCGS